MTSAMDTGIITRATSVMTALMDSIMASTPTTVTAEVIIWVTPWFRLWPRVSTSLVMRESVSPVEFLSKYPKGTRSILRAMASRRR